MSGKHPGQVRHLIVAVGIALAGFTGTASATTFSYTLANHPDSGNVEGIQPPTFGMRLDGLLTGDAGEIYLLDFDDAASDVNLTYDSDLDTIHISGTALGGQDADSGNCPGVGCDDNNGNFLADATEALWTLDFTYTSVTTIANGGSLDLLVSDGHANGGGTLNSGLGNFDLRGHDDSGGLAFQFGDEGGAGHRGYNGLSGWGWADYSCGGGWCGSDDNFPGTPAPYTVDWLFIAIPDTGTPPLPVPPALWLLGSGLLGLAGMVRRRRN